MAGSVAEGPPNIDHTAFGPMASAHCLPRHHAVQARVKVDLASEVLLRNYPAMFRKVRLDDDLASVDASD